MRTYDWQNHAMVIRADQQGAYVLTAEARAEVERLTDENKRLREALEDMFDPYQRMVACQKGQMEKCMCWKCVEGRASQVLKGE